MYRIITEMEYSKIKKSKSVQEIIDVLKLSSTIDREEMETILNALIDLDIDEVLQDKIKIMMMQNE